MAIASVATQSLGNQMKKQTIILISQIYEINSCIMIGTIQQCFRPAILETVLTCFRSTDILISNSITVHCFWLPGLQSG